MFKNINKRIAIVVMFKAGKSPGEISKILNLKIKRMLVWRTFKRYGETGKVENRPGQGRPRSARTQKLIKATRENLRRNPKRSIRTAKIPPKDIRATCKAFPKRLQPVINAKGGHIE